MSHAQQTVFDPTAPDESERQSEPSELVIPLIAEELKIRKELVEQATVRLTKTVHETPELVREFLASEYFEIERVPMDEVVATAPSVRMEGDVIVIPVIEEVLVVTKELHLKEELRVVKKRVVKEFVQETTLRREELTVERLGHSKTDR